MQEYNNGITDTLARNTRRSIASLPQPTMFGGKRARIHPKAGTTQYDYPGTLAVGRFSQTPRLLGAGFWQDFGRGFKQGAVGTAKVAAPIVGEIAKDAALSYIRGGKRKKYTLGSFAKDLGDVAQPFKEQVVPVATGVAKEVARDAIKSYLKGGALIKNRPQEFHSDIYPQALASYRPQDSHMFGGKKRKAPSKRKPKGGARYDSDSDDEEMTGGRGVLDDLVKVSKAAAPYVPLMMMAAGRKKKKMTGGKGIADDIAKIAKAGEAYIPLARQAMMGGRKQLPRSGHKREVARGDIVAAVMRQQGISLGAASKYVKDNGLY